MEKCKCITNLTGHDISVTIYVAEFTKQGLRKKETHTMDISPKESVEISFGDIVNSFISGIEVSSVINDVEVTSSQRSDSTTSEFSVAINQKHFIEINDVQTLAMDLIA